MRERPRWMRPPAGADALGQPALERRLAILIGQLDPPHAALVLLGQRREAVAYQRKVCGRQQPLRVQHLGMRDRGAHVVAHQAFIERDSLHRRCTRSTRASSGAPLSHRRVMRCCFGRGQCVDVSHDQGAGALVGEHLGQDAVGGGVGDHVHAAHAAANRKLDRLGLGQHAVGDAAGIAQARQSGQVGVGDDRRRIVNALEDAGRAGAQDQLFGAQRRADGRGHGVGVDVEQRALVIGRQRTDHRHQPVVQVLADDADVDRIDVADETEVDALGAGRQAASAGADGHGSARHRRPTGRPR